MKSSKPRLFCLVVLYSVSFFATEGFRGLVKAPALSLDKPEGVSHALPV